LPDLAQLDHNERRAEHKAELRHPQTSYIFGATALHGRNTPVNWS
jgi:hypothetical protein